VDVDDLPDSVAWRHLGVRDGFEVLFLTVTASGLTGRGRTSAVQDGNAWAVRYEIELDPAWYTRRATVGVDDDTGTRIVELLVNDDGWRVDGGPRPDLAGCVDVDLEASAFTNALPMRRLALSVGEQVDAPAAFVTATGEVERLEQNYRRLPDADGQRRYDYRAPVFDFHAELTYDAKELVVDYPGLAARVL
jgi:uncharacterized protein